MSDGTAVKDKPDEQEAKTPEEIEKDKAAEELLKELGDLEEESEEAGGGDKDDGPTGEGEDAKGDDGEESESAADTQPKGKRGFKKRIDRLSKQREEAKRDRDETAAKLRQAQREKELLQMKVDQLSGKQRLDKKPDPDDFDLGEHDEKYIEAKEKWDEARLQKLVDSRVAEQVQTHTQTGAQQEHERELKKKQEAHWEKADELGVEDYDAKEEKLIEVMGAEMVNNIIDYFPEDSHNLVYYLGTNEDEAEELTEQLANPKTMVAAVAKIGRLSERIKADPIKPKPSPNPDTNLDPSAPSAQEALQLRLDKIRDNFVKTGEKGGMKKIMEFKRRARDRGIELS